MTLTTLRRLGGLIPRFSIGNLLMLMVVVGLCLAWYDQRRKLNEQAEVIDQQRLEIIRLAVNNILREDVTDAEKARGIAKFVRLGDRLEEVEKWCGAGLWPEGDGIGPLVFPDCDLCISCDPNHVICGWGYYKRLDPGHPVHITYRYTWLGGDEALVPRQVP